MLTENQTNDAENIKSLAEVITQRRQAGALDCVESFNLQNASVKGRQSKMKQVNSSWTVGALNGQVTG